MWIKSQSMPSCVLPSPASLMGGTGSAGKKIRDKAPAAPDIPMRPKRQMGQVGLSHLPGLISMVQKRSVSRIFFPAGPVPAIREAGDGST